MLQSDLTSPLKKSKPWGFKCYTIRVLKGQVELIISLKAVTWRRPTTDKEFFTFFRNPRPLQNNAFSKEHCLIREYGKYSSYCDNVMNKSVVKSNPLLLYIIMQSFKVIGHCSSDKVFLSSTLSKKKRKCVRLIRSYYIRITNEPN